MSSVNKSSFVFSFPICIPFISFSRVTELARTSNTVLRSSDRGQTCLFSDLSWKVFSFYHLV